MERGNEGLRNAIEEGLHSPLLALYERLAHLTEPPSLEYIVSSLAFLIERSRTVLELVAPERLSRGQPPVVLSVSRMLEQVRRIVVAEIEEKRQELVFAADPDADDEFVGEGDLLQRALVGLVDHVSRASVTGSVLVLSVTARRLNNERVIVRFVLTSNARSMISDPTPDLDRNDGVASSGFGGLGLSNVGSIAGRLGARLLLAPSSAGGIRVSFALPMTRVAPSSIS